MKSSIGDVDRYCLEKYILKVLEENDNQMKDEAKDEWVVYALKKLGTIQQ